MATRKNAAEDSEKDDDDSYVEKASREIAEKQKAAEHEERAEPEREEPNRNNPNLVDLDDEDESTETQETARDRRRNRYREQKEAREAAERERDQLRQEAERERLRADAMAIAMQQARGGQQPQGDRYAETLKKLDDENEQLMDHYARLPEAEQRAKLAEFRQRQGAIERRRIDLMVEQRLGAMPTPPSPVDSFMVSQFPEIHTHRQGPDLVKAHMRRLIALGKPEDFNTLREAAESARDDLFPNARPARPRTAGAPPAASSLRAKLSYSGSHGGAAAAPRRRVVDMGSEANKHHRMMARELYPNMPEKKAYAVYARKYMVDADDE